MRLRVHGRRFRRRHLLSLLSEFGSDSVDFHRLMSIHTYVNIGRWSRPRFWQCVPGTVIM